MEHSPSLVSHVMKRLNLLLQKQSMLLPSARKALTPSAESEVKGQGNVAVCLAPGCTAVSFPSQGGCLALEQCLSSSIFQRKQSHLVVMCA